MKKIMLTLFAIFFSVFSFSQSHETQAFDKAVKKHFPEWKGYVNYDWANSNDENTKQGLAILQQIDSLDLTNNALSRVPKEILQCPNLKFLNLLDNPKIDWQDAYSTISKTKINSVYVSVNDLSDIDSTYWHLITGIEILKNGLNAFPDNILRQKQLEYLYLNNNKLTTLPPEIGNLKSLAYLYIGEPIKSYTPRNWEVN